MSSTTAIDSLQLFIPIEKVTMISRQGEMTKPLPLASITIIDPRLTSRVIEVYDETGEERTIKNQQPLTHENKGIVTGYRIQKKSIGPATVTGLSLAITAKVLKDRYLEGITKNSIDRVFQEINAHGIIEISYDDFLNARVEMADLKRDTIHEDLDDEFGLIARRINPGTRFKRHSNGNLTIGQRTKANNSNLYIKWYRKKLELETNSYEFLSNHEPNCPENLLRTEITLHRAHLNEHFKTSNYDGTLGSLLASVNQQGDAVMAKILNDYLTNDPREPEANDRQKPDKDETAVREIVSLLFQVPGFRDKRLSDFQEKVLLILNPGINKVPKIKRLVETYFIENDNAETDLQPFLIRGGALQ